jgi:pyruvate dehydrogenase E1 component
MDALFREIKIYAPQGQKYEPVDHHLLLSYAEATDGQILEEGITEAGSLASWTAAATSYATRGVPMVPFFTFYSMFGFQRVGDLIWQAADARARGFLLGATAGRTTLMGEGLQHQDGHSHVLASTVPPCRAYDPAFAYEVATLVRHGIHEMYGPDPKDVFYYLTLYNENHPMPAMPEGATEGIIEGLYRWAGPPEGTEARASILFSGTAHLAARAAQEELAAEHGIGVDLWSAPGWKQLREEALAVDRWNRLHPGEPARTPRVTQLLADGAGPVVAVTDYMAAVPDQVSRWVPRPYVVLGTDGFGRSDTREALRSFFETDSGHVVVATLSALARAGEIDPAEVGKATARHGIDTEAQPPWTR